MQKRHRLRVLLCLSCACALLVIAGCGSSSTSGGNSGGSTITSASSVSNTTVAAGVPAGCQPSQTKTKYPEVAGKTLNVAVSPLSPPYIYTSPSNPNQITGFEADLMADWAKCLGVSWKWQIYQAFGNMVPAVQSGRDDVIQSSIFATPVRAKQVNFVVYMKSYTGSIVAKGNPQHLTSLSDICGKHVAEVVGGVEVAIAQAQSAQCTKDGKPAVKLSLYQDNATAEQQVLDGRSDIWMVDAGLAAVLVKKSPTQLQTAYSVDSGLKIGTAINKSETQLEAAADAALTQLQTDGIIKTLLAKWGIQPDQAIPVAEVNG
jgi:polar amino acid transport system substrate-binding protein